MLHSMPTIGRVLFHLVRISRALLPKPHTGLQKPRERGNKMCYFKSIVKPKGVYNIVNLLGHECTRKKKKKKPIKKLYKNTLVSRKKEQSRVYKKTTTQ